MTTTSGPGQEPGARLRRIAIIAIAILLLSLLYLAQISIARGPWTLRQSIELTTRSAAEWTAWAMMAPAILRFAARFPLGVGQPRRNWLAHVSACALAMPIWAGLVAIPMSVIGLPMWGAREPGGFFEAAESGLLQRGGYLAIVYGLIVGFATAQRLMREREAAATRTEELRRELAAADLDRFTRLIGSDSLAERLNNVEAAMAVSVDQAEAETLVLAAELHDALVRTRDMLK